MYTILYTKRTKKEIENLKSAKLDGTTLKLIEVLKNNPFQNPPPYEKLTGDLKNYYSRRINAQHRLVYQVFNDENIVKIVSLWSHYENII